MNQQAELPDFSKLAENNTELSRATRRCPVAGTIVREKWRPVLQVLKEVGFQPVSFMGRELHVHTDAAFAQTLSRHGGTVQHFQSWENLAAAVKFLVHATIKAQIEKTITTRGLFDEELHKAGFVTVTQDDRGLSCYGIQQDRIAQAISKPLTDALKAFEKRFHAMYGKHVADVTLAATKNASRFSFMSVFRGIAGKCTSSVDPCEPKTVQFGKLLVHQR